MSLNDNPKGDWQENMALQEKLMDELTELAKQHKTLWGRILKFQMGDSYAVYVISKIKGDRVEVQWVKYCDGWSDDRLSFDNTLSVEYVNELIRREDALAKIFSK